MQHPMIKRRAIALASGATAIVALALTTAQATTIQAGNLTITADGSVSPKALPKHTKAPITLNLSSTIKTDDATHVPALRTLFLQFDKNGGVNTKGMPTCTVGKITNTLTAQAMSACAPALVGTGTVSAEVQFPDSNPVPAKGKLLIFNGSKGGKPIFIQHAYVNQPVSATIVTTAPIENISGKYGTQTTITIPPIAGGYGSLTGFTATLHKDFTYKGKKQSVFLAQCPTGHFFAHGEFKFVDGTDLKGDVVKSCKGKG